MYARTFCFLARSVHFGEHLFDSIIVEKTSASSRMIGTGDRVSQIMAPMLGAQNCDLFLCFRFDSRLERLCIRTTALF